MKNNSDHSGHSSALMPNYRPLDVNLVRGQGCELFDDEGKRYLDFSAGMAVSGLGHAHPKVIAAIQEQAGRILHRSNLYRQTEQEDVAQQLRGLSSADDYQVLFCNSGAEANETAVKIARRYHFARGQKKRSTIATLEGSFHGRTLAMIFASGKKRYTEGFGPSLPGFIQIPDLEESTLKTVLLRPDLAAILVEPIQGENGIIVQENLALQQLSDLCKKHGVLLMVDEVQSGNGRSGMMWCHQHAGIVPDIITTAKGMGSGIPVGAALAREHIAACLLPGLHGSTFGGNPIAMAACKATLEVIAADGFFESVSTKGKLLHAGLTVIGRRFQQPILEVRGKGLMQGIALSPEIQARDLSRKLSSLGLLTVPADNNTLRFLPPLIVSEAQIDEALSIISTGIETEIKQQQGAA